MFQWCCIAQSVNKYSFITAWQNADQQLKQKDNTVSKEKAGLENKPKNWACYRVRLNRNTSLTMRPIATNVLM